ncbi:hypothetical protein [Halopiger goleimassiliensis]|uniref:hypothetical protein n=1 Tax=Halopiger goleimassiliensis TaxID=1293048 RepID=UPI000677F23B|nr:hypothetical protein [Halopiger goleimassiliensis]
MEPPPQLEAVANETDAVTITERDYADEHVIAVDFGQTGDKPSLDRLEETAIVVVDGEQYEFDVPEEATEVTVNDGILTIRSDS